MADVSERKAPVIITITGAAGQIAYSLIPPLASGTVFGMDQPIIFKLLDIPPGQEMLKGVVMEIEDLAYPLVAGVVATADPTVAFKDCDFAIFLGAFPRKEGMERKDVMEKNVGIFNSQGSALANFAKPTVKSLVVGNPANTNAAILAAAAPALPKTSFSALTRLDHNRAQSLAASKMGIPCDELEGIIIWGNHSSTQYPDVRHAASLKSGAKVMDVVPAAYLEGDFLTTIQKRGAAIIAARKLSSAASAAKAICDHMRDWVLGSKGRIVSMGVYSDGSLYGAPPGVYYSMPVKCSPGGTYEVVPGLPIDDFSKSKMALTAAELADELALANQLLGK